MWKIEYVEVVEVGEHVALDCAQLVPWQPETEKVETRTKSVYYYLVTKIVGQLLSIFFLSETLRVNQPEPVELGQRREIVVVHLHNQVVAKVERLQTENTSIKQYESTKATLEGKWKKKDDNKLRD